MKTQRRFRDYLNEQLKDSSVRKAYEEEGVFVELATQIADIRAKQGLSQQELARRLH